MDDFQYTVFQLRTQNDFKEFLIFNYSKLDYKFTFHNTRKLNAFSCNFLTYVLCLKAKQIGSLHNMRYIGIVFSSSVLLSTSPAINRI